MFEFFFGILLFVIFNVLCLLGIFSKVIKSSIHAEDGNGEGSLEQ